MGRMRICPLSFLLPSSCLPKKMSRYNVSRVFKFNSAAVSREGLGLLKWKSRSCKSQTILAGEEICQGRPHQQMAATRVLSSNPGSYRSRAVNTTVCNQEPVTLLLWGFQFLT